jgi:hypothetical protein
MKLHADICLIAILGVAILCKTGGDGNQPVVVSDFCEQTVGEVAKFKGLTDAEIAALQRPRKEAILSLRRKHARLCANP